MFICRKEENIIIILNEGVHSNVDAILQQMNVKN